MKKITQVVTFIMIVVMLSGLGQQQVNAADNITKSTVADSETINNWHDANALDDSTKNVDAYGRTNLYPQGTSHLQADRMSHNQSQLRKVQIRIFW